MSYADGWGDFEEGFSRHLRNLGYVPPEFREHQRIPVKEPYICTTTNAAMKSLLMATEWHALEEAAVLAHRKAPGAAEGARVRGGYGGLGGEDFIIPDQRPLLQGGDNNPLD